MDLYSDGEYLGNYLLCKEPDEYINGIDQYLIEKMTSILKINLMVSKQRMMLFH